MLGPPIPAITPASVTAPDAAQSIQRQEPHPGVEHARRSAGSGGRQRRARTSSWAASAPTRLAALANIKASILQVNGILYVSTPDNAWAMDARDGHEIWHYVWKTRGGTHIGNRGLGMWGNWLYMETPDDYLVCLDAKTGKERWHKPIADFDLQYFSTVAPIVVGNHILVGTGNDLDEPGFLQSFDPETGEVQWKFYAVPMKPGDPGLETWANLDAARHGGGNMWVPGSYDPETHLYIFGTGNPSPAYTSQARGEGDNLYTCSIVAVNVDTGKMVWYYQTSPHDTHDWDSAQTPVLVDAEFNGNMRKLVLTASRNGYYFTLDRLTGEHLVTRKFSDSVELGEGRQREGPARSRPRQGFPHRRIAGIAGKSRRDQLAAAGIQSRHGSLLCPRGRELRHVLSG